MIINTNTIQSAQPIVMLVLGAGISWLIKGQWSIRKEAKEGRKELHKKIDKYTTQLTTLVAQHKINHPGQ